MVAKVTPEIAKQDGYKFGFNDNDNAVYKYRTEKGLSEDIVREISRVKNEPQWMTDFRLKSYHHFLEKPMPTGFWGGSIQNYDARLQRHLLLRPRLRPRRGQTGTTCRSTSRTRSRSSASRRRSGSR